LVFVYLPSIISAAGEGVETKKPVIDAVASLQIPIVDFWTTLHAKDNPESYYQGHYTPQGYIMLVNDIITYLKSKNYPPPTEEIEAETPTVAWDSIEPSLYSGYSQAPSIENGSFEKDLLGWNGPGDCTTGWPGEAKFTSSISTQTKDGSRFLSLVSANHISGVSTKVRDLDTHKLYSLSFRYKNAHLDLDQKPKMEFSLPSELYYFYDKMGALPTLRLPSFYTSRPSTIARLGTLYHIRKLLFRKKNAMEVRSQNEWQETRTFFVARDAEATLFFYCPSNGRFINTCSFDDFQITPIDIAALKNAEKK
jgi:hypothetical protein